MSELGSGSRPRAVAQPLAVVGGVLIVTLAVAAAVLMFALGIDASGLADDSTGGVVGWTAFGVVGAVVASKRPSIATGWLLLAVGLGMVANTFGMSYARYGLVTDPGALPAAEVVAWLHLAHVGGFVALPLILLTFPTGRPPTRRWWVLVAWLVFTGTLLLGVLAWGLAVHGVMWVVTETRFGELGVPAAIDVVGALGYFGTLAGFPLAAVALLLRFRRSSGTERQQMKWLAFAVLLIAVTMPLGELNAAGWAVSMLALAGLPVAIGVAVVRYHLYDIDRVVRRTVSYALVTAILAGLYVVAVLVLGGLVRAATGGAGGDLVVAASTLLVAAAFGPVRRRVQAGVDRRFNRARYDAQRTVESFGQRLRDQVDLGALADDLHRTVETATRPSFVALWLPESSS